MKVKINYDETLEKNASIYFEKSKKAKKKLEGANKALEISKKKLEKLISTEKKDKKKREALVRPPKPEWYEKFRWFFTSNGLLAIGGRDAISNEIIIKKHVLADDLVFHTDMTGSPFFVLKNGKDSDESILREVADATCSFSRAWKLGLGTQSVFYVSPDQVTKTPNTGEYLVKGSFVIRGKTNYIENKINLAIGITKENRLVCGPSEGVIANCENVVIIEQGEKKSSEVAKLLKKIYNYSDLDGIIRILPTGGIKIKK